jgi:hypothetical protein
MSDIPPLKSLLRRPTLTLILLMAGTEFCPMSVATQLMVRLGSAPELVGFWLVEL